jgi:hypothetical protein
VKKKKEIQENKKGKKGIGRYSKGKRQTGK